jgi:RHH-type proline utilization regulon transcriptional repressor/proline dehydrogenase/delta 1-pyrroline-5-carboxylate dehydrogenase
MRMGDVATTDVGPVIDEELRLGIQDHIDAARTDGRGHTRLSRRTSHSWHRRPSEWTVLLISPIEGFLTVLHIATYKSGDGQGYRDINRLRS